jgi:hypothetical protein
MTTTEPIETTPAAPIIRATSNQEFRTKSAAAVKKSAPAKKAAPAKKPGKKQGAAKRKA